MAKTFIQSLGFRKFRHISFGFSTALFLVWSLFNATSFVPAGLELKVTLAFLAYGITGVYFIGRLDLRSKLDNVSLLKALPYFLGSGFLTFYLFSFLLGFVNTPETILSVLVGVPFYIQLSNALIFAVVEGSAWQGVLDEKIGIFGSMVVAGFFHMFIWSGSLLQNFIGSALLFGIFSFVNFQAVKFFSRRMPRKTAVALGLVVSIGFHWGYNLAKYRGLFGL